MNYKETIDFLFNIPQGIEKGLNRAKRFMDKLGNPQDKLKYIHVGGTNGKGSTCTMLSTILTKAGYKTGLNISPHIMSFRERIQVNNKIIPEDDVVRLTKKIRVYYNEMELEGEAPNYFEVVFAIAVLYFLEQKCDIVVAEVGLGGRIDATNIIDTVLVSVITKIDIDHISRLGSSIEGIAKEKAGIIKKGGITVCYPSQDVDALAEIMEAASRKENKLVIPHNCIITGTGLWGSSFVYNELEYKISLIGVYQVYNTLMVLEVCNILNELGYSISYSDIYTALESISFPARMEIISYNPLVILDGAHNVAGAKALGSALDLVGGKRIHGVVGILSEKDVAGIVKEIAPKLYSAVATQGQKNKRFMAPEKLVKELKQYIDKVSYTENPIDAFNSAFGIAEKEDAIIVTGSFYLIGEIRGYIIEKTKGMHNNEH